MCRLGARRYCGLFIVPHVDCICSDNLVPLVSIRRDWRCHGCSVCDRPRRHGARLAITQRNSRRHGSPDDASLSKSCSSRPTSRSMDDLALVSIFPILLWIAARCRPFCRGRCVHCCACNRLDDNIRDWTIRRPKVFRLLIVFSPLRRPSFRSRSAHWFLRHFLPNGVRGGAIAGGAEGRGSGRPSIGTSVVIFRGVARSGATSGSRPETKCRRRFFERVHPDDRLRVKTCLLDLRPDNPRTSSAYRYLRPDGQQMWLESTAKAEFDKAGQIVRIRGLSAGYYRAQAGRR